MNAAEHLPETAWKTPDCYGGFNPVGDYLILSRHRDSDLLAESNWATACASLGAIDHDSGDLPTRPSVYTFRAGSWAVGWIEYLLVRPDAPAATLQEAGEIICTLADYPILSDAHFSELEYRAASDIWQKSSITDRVRYLRQAGLRIFAARRDGMPNDGTSSLQRALLGT
jgi:hypothetical protein